MRKAWKSRLACKPVPSRRSFSPSRRQQRRLEPCERRCVLPWRQQPAPQQHAALRPPPPRQLQLRRQRRRAGPGGRAQHEQQPQWRWSATHRAQLPPSPPAAPLPRAASLRRRAGRRCHQQQEAPQPSSDSQGALALQPRQPQTWRQEIPYARGRARAAPPPVRRGDGTVRSGGPQSADDDAGRVSLERGPPAAPAPAARRRDRDRARRYICARGGSSTEDVTACSLSSSSSSSSALARKVKEPVRS